jgi:activator of 2-hydroxyglutaryl-CoA dehydratase
VQSDYDSENRAAHKVELIIGQDWTDIVIRFIGPNSKSHSTSASMIVTEDECILIYDYLNEPNAEAVETMEMHRGTTRLVLTGNDELEGYYYTGRGRKNTGSLKVRRTELSLASRAAPCPSPA